MRILLDTNVLLHLALDPEVLPSAMKNSILEADELYLSSISRAEIAIKSSIGKLHLPIAEPIFWEQISAQLQASELSFDSAHAAVLAILPMHHRDPFDRMLIAQCLVEDLTLATTDSALLAYEIKGL